MTDLDPVALLGSAYSTLQPLPLAQFAALRPETRIEQFRIEDVLEEGRLRNDLMGFLHRTVEEKELNLIFVFPTVQNELQHRFRTMVAAIKGIQTFSGYPPCRIIIAYQGTDATPLCSLMTSGVELHINDGLSLWHRGQMVVSAEARGKAENLLKSLARLLAAGEDVERTLVVTVDDDYTLNHPLNQLLLTIPWIFSQARAETVPAELDPLWSRSQRIAFTKSGSQRLLLPREFLNSIIEGKKPPLTYRELLAWLLEGNHSQLLSDQLMGPTLTRLDASIILTPDNLGALLGQAIADAIEDVCWQYLQLGGRTVNFLTALFSHQSDNLLYQLLLPFTFLLHGDQATTLGHWISINLGRKYRLEIAWLVQALLDARFADWRLANIIGLPHAHLPKQALASREMGLEIISTLDLLGVAYGTLEPARFMMRYGTSRRTLSRFPSGRVRFNSQPWPFEDMPILYPPIRDMEMRWESPAAEN